MISLLNSARGVRLFNENRADHASDNAVHKAISPKPGCSPDRLRAWCQQAERDAGEHSGLASEDKTRPKALERESRELCQANEMLKNASAFLPLFSVIAAQSPARATGTSPTANSADVCLYREVRHGCRHWSDAHAARNNHRSVPNWPAARQGLALQCPKGGSGDRPVCILGEGRYRTHA